MIEVIDTGQQVSILCSGASTQSRATIAPPKHIAAGCLQGKQASGTFLEGCFQRAIAHLSRRRLYTPNECIYPSPCC